ncbi:hypothetical protein EDD16DRAFT_1521005 [Pisolithus croceorrhizus]|nr:hypothetical protein EDD16DRAFT_1521005 [Pisolithus croceorrhizus]
MTEMNHKYVSINLRAFIHQLTDPHDKIDEASPSEDDRYRALILSPGIHSITEARCITPFLARSNLIPTTLLKAIRGSPEHHECYYQAPTCNLAIAAQEPEDIVAAHRLGDQETLPTTQVLAKSQEILSATETATHGHGVLDMDMTKPVGPATEGTEPWKLQYYDPSTHDIIDHAKQFSHCDTMSINAFPVHSTFNAKTIDYIEEAIAEHRMQHPHISEGLWPYRCLLGNGGLFLKNGVDDEGHANNLTHPVLTGLIADFFYSGSTSVSQLFPEVFSPEVPRVAMAIATTAICEVNFRVTTYSPIYVEILGLMSKCDTSPIHQAKT